MIIKCPECGKEINDKAKSCPNCGFPIVHEEEKPKVYVVKLNDSMTAETQGNRIKILSGGKLIMESPVKDFVLIYGKEEPDELGKEQLKVAFSSEKCSKPFKICVNVESDSYSEAKEFVMEIAEKHFKKDLIENWYRANEYAFSHADSTVAIETAATIQNAENERKNIYKETNKATPFWGSPGFIIVALLFFWPVGLPLMWIYKPLGKKARIVWTAAVIGLTAFVLYSNPFKIGTKADSISSEELFATCKNLWEVEQLQTAVMSDTEKYGTSNDENDEERHYEDVVSEIYNKELENTSIIKPDDKVSIDAYVVWAIELASGEKWQDVGIKKSGAYRIQISLDPDAPYTSYNEFAMFVRTDDSYVMKFTQGQHVHITGTFLKSGAISDGDYLYDCKITAY